MQKYNTIIIGSGPAGLFAAANIHRGKTLILEKKALPGRKLMISGSGQCNFTNSIPISDFKSHYGDHFDFLEPALTTFSNRDAVQWFAKRGVKSTTDKNGKIFPAGMQAHDILNALLKAGSEQNVVLKTGCAVQEVSVDEGLFVVKSNDTHFTSTHLIIATGGLSYPSTGSTGDGYTFSKALGHSIVSPKPALCPVWVNDHRSADLAGVSLHNAAIELFRNDRKIRSHRGDIVFTHKGLSGPGILDFSRFFEAGDVLKINFCGLPSDEFERLFFQTAAENGKLQLNSFLKNIGLTRSLAMMIATRAGISHNKPLAELSKLDRKNLIALCCNHPFIIEKLSGFKAAMTTAGGVSLNEVNPMTMESTIIKNLYFAGEVLDIDGDTGGYNIQAAFSTAWLASQSINKKG